MIDRKKLAELIEKQYAENEEYYKTPYLEAKAISGLTLGAIEPEAREAGSKLEKVLGVAVEFGAMTPGFGAASKLAKFGTKAVGLTGRVARIGTEAGIGAIVGAVEHAENERERVAHILENAAIFGAFGVAAEGVKGLVKKLRGVKGKAGEAVPLADDEMGEIIDKVSGSGTMDKFVSLLPVPIRSRFEWWAKQRALLTEKRKKVVWQTTLADEGGVMQRMGDTQQLGGVKRKLLPESTDKTLAGETGIWKRGPVSLKKLDLREGDLVVNIETNELHKVKSVAENVIGLTETGTAGTRQVPVAEFRKKYRFQGKAEDAVIPKKRLNLEDELRTVSREITEKMSVGSGQSPVGSQQSAVGSPQLAVGSEGMLSPIDEVERFKSESPLPMGTPFGIAPVGVVAGIEQDEEGNWQIDPTKALAGVVGSVAIGAKAPGFFSKLERLIAEKMPKRAAAADVKNIIMKGGIKEEEAKYSGVLDWLTGKKAVTKDEVVEYLKEGQVEVREVVKGAENIDWNVATYNLAKALRGKVTDGAVIDTIAEQIAQGSEVGAKRLADEVGTKNAQVIVNDLKRSYKNRASKSRYEQYQLPGGENYRELLLTLPEKATPTRWVRDKDIWVIAGDDNQLRYIERINDNYYKAHEGGGMLETGFKSLKEAQEELEHDFTGQFKVGGGQYKSSHWEEPNVVAHVRFNERTDAEGKKVLFIEEVQSDWHQAGRKKGYGLKTDKLPEGYTVRQPNEEESIEGAWGVYDKEGNIFSWADEKDDAIRFAINAINDNTVPDAPFKKTWPELAMKRMVRWASEHGFDRVAWTTGKQQAERYDLRKQIEAIYYTKDEKLFVLPRGKNNYELLANAVPEEKLEDYIGKDATQKLIKTEADEFGRRMIQGEDLAVGGEGMNAFYDKMLPELMDKMGKKWGARTKPSEIVTVPGFKKYMIYDEKNRYLSEHDSLKEAEGLIKNGLGVKIRTITQTPTTEKAFSIDINPEMKKEVMGAGQPLFAVAGGLAGVGQDEQGNVTFDPEKALIGLGGGLMLGTVVRKIGEEQLKRLIEKIGQVGKKGQDFIRKQFEVKLAELGELDEVKAKGLETVVDTMLRNAKRKAPGAERGMGAGLKKGEKINKSNVIEKVNEYLATEYKLAETAERFDSISGEKIIPLYKAKAGEIELGIVIDDLRKKIVITNIATHKSKLGFGREVIEGIKKLADRNNYDVEAFKVTNDKFWSNAGFKKIDAAIYRYSPVSDKGIGSGLKKGVGLKAEAEAAERAARMKEEAAGMFPPEEAAKAAERAKSILENDTLAELQELIQEKGTGATKRVMEELNLTGKSVLDLTEKEAGKVKKVLEQMPSQSAVGSQAVGSGQSAVGGGKAIPGERTAKVKETLGRMGKFLDMVYKEGFDKLNLERFGEINVAHSQATAAAKELNERIAKDVISSSGKVSLKNTKQQVADFKAAVALNLERDMYDTLKWNELFAQAIDGQRDPVTREFLVRVQKIIAENKPMLKEYTKAFQDDFALYKDVLKDNDLKEEFVENYVTHLWDLTGETIPQKRVALKTQFQFAKERNIPSYLEGVAFGMKPLGLDIVAISDVYKKNLATVLENRKFIKSLMGQTIQTPGGEQFRAIVDRKAFDAMTGMDQRMYTTVNHKAFSQVYVHNDVAKDIKKVFETSNWRDMWYTRGFKKVNQLMKRLKLSMSGFHFVSLGYNSVLFGGDKWWKIGNPLPFDVFNWKSDMKKGLDAYMKRNPVLEHGLRNGLVMEEGMGADYYKTFRNNLEAWPTQKGLSGKVKGTAEGLGKIWDHALWDQYAPGLKAAGFMTIYAKQLKYLKKAFPKEYEEWAATGFANTFKTRYESLCAQKAAADVNSLWGGMNYELLKISRTSQDWMRSVFLAHDWTMSNWFDLINGFRGLKDIAGGKGVNRAAGERLIKSTVILGTLSCVMNKLATGKPPWENPEGYKGLTAIGEIDGKPYYMDTWRQFGDMFKIFKYGAEGKPGTYFYDSPLRYLLNRSSSIIRLIDTIRTGEDWRGRPLADIEALKKGKLYQSIYKPYWERGSVLPGVLIQVGTMLIPIPVEAGLQSAIGDKDWISTGASVFGVHVKEYNGNWAKWKYRGKAKGISGVGGIRGIK